MSTLHEHVGQLLRRHLDRPGELPDTLNHALRLLAKYHALTPAHRSGTRRSGVPPPRRMAPHPATGGTSDRLSCAIYQLLRRLLNAQAGCRKQDDPRAFRQFLWR